MPRYASGKSQQVDFTEFAPDLSPDTPGILLNMSGARPTMKGFAALNSPIQYGSALPAAPNGAMVAYYSTGTSSVIAGTSAHLYRYSAGVPVLIDGGQVYAATSRWRFFQFGDDVIACAQGVAPQVATGPLGAFSTLTGNAPVGATTGTSTLGTAFLFAGSSWYASAIGQDNNWTPNVQTLAASGNLYDYPGPVTAAVPFYGTVIVFKAPAIWVGSLGGIQWGFQLISADTGTWNQESTVILPDAIAFLGSDDFYITSGSIPTRIPNKLKEWVFANVNPAQLPKTFAWYDDENSTIYWHMVSNNTPVAGVPDIFVAYNYRFPRWCVGHLVTPCVPWPNMSPGFQTGFFYFDTGWKLQQLIGSPATMSLTTGFMGDNSRATQLLKVRARYNVRPSSQRLALFNTNILGRPVKRCPTDPIIANDDWFNLRSYARYHQATFSTVGACEIMGFAYEGRMGGDR